MDDNAKRFLQRAAPVTSTGRIGLHWAWRSDAGTAMLNIMSQKNDEESQRKEAKVYTKWHDSKYII